MAYQIDASPLPPELELPRRFSTRGMHQLGLDGEIYSWRAAVSRHAAQQLLQIEQQHGLGAVVVNTQSAGLDLVSWAERMPVWVAMDATFRQLSRTPWFAPWPIARLFHRWTLGKLFERERELCRVATRFLPWSESVAESLKEDYGVSSDRILRLPPSVALPEGQQVSGRIHLDIDTTTVGADPTSEKFQSEEATHDVDRPRLLFIGGDFRRKGGMILVDTWRKHLSDRCDLDVVTETSLPQYEHIPGLRVHRGVSAGSVRWLTLWRSATAFILPSRLETFGIVLLEALAFRVPIIASRAGAAIEILGNGHHGLLLPDVNETTLLFAIRQVLDDPKAAQERASTGHDWWRERYELETNTERLAKALRSVVPNKQR